MLILSTVNDRLQVITGSAGTIDVHASWMDNASGTVTPGRTNTAITTATTTSVAGGPAAATQRNVKTLHVANKGTGNVTITVQHTDGTTAVQLHSVSLPAGGTLEYIDEVGFGLNLGGEGTFFPENNLVLNGAMEVSQEKGTTAQTSVSTTKYILDQFKYSVVGTAVVTLQQVSDAPAGLKNSLKVSVTTADASIAAGDFAVVYTLIEGYRTARLGFGAAGATPIALGFWVKHHRTGVYTGAVQNSAANRAFTFEYTVVTADTWEYKTAVIPADTTGTWLTTNGIGLSVFWCLAVGSTFQTAAGTWAAGNFTGTSNNVNGVGAVTDTFQISGVCLLPGVVPVPQDMSPDMQLAFDAMLLLCQRHYEKSYDYATALGTVTANGQSRTGQTNLAAGAHNTWTPVEFKANKRTAPSVTFYSPNTGTSGQCFDSFNAVDAAVTLDNAGETALTWNVNAAGGTQVNLMVHWAADARL